MTSPAPRPEIIEKLANGANSAFAMLAGMQLDLFTPLKDGPMGTEQIANALGVGSVKLKPLLYALVAAGLLTVEGELFSNTSEADRFLVQGEPAYIGWRHHTFSNHWGGLSKTAESILAGSAQDRHDFSAMSKEELEAFSRRSYPRAVTLGRELAALYDFSTYHHLLDVGGGTGGLAIAITEVCPHLHATVVDQANITPLTHRFVTEAAASRVRVLTADVVNEPLVGSYDVAVLSYFIPVLSSDQARRALQNVGQVIEPGGSAYILSSGILDNSRLSPPEAVSFNLFYINISDLGGSYTEQEHKEWLAEAGFVEGFERVTLPDGSGIIRSRKPA